MGAQVKQRYFEINLLSNADRRVLIDKVCDHLNLKRVKFSTVDDVIMLCEDNSLEFKGIPSEPFYKLRVYVPNEPALMAPDESESKPSGIPPNKSIGETEEVMKKVDEVLPTPEEVRAKKIKVVKTNDDDDLPFD